MSQTNPQSVSTLVSKLPLEIREEIYKHIVLGWGRSHIVHIQEKNSHFRHYRCQTKKTDAPCDGNHVGALESLRFPGPRSQACDRLWSEFKGKLGTKCYSREGRVDNLMPVLISCREIYNEMIPLLYSGTAFHFREASSVLTFTQSIPMQRRNAIRSLYIEWDIADVHSSSSAQKWQGIWNTIAGMEEIRDVRLIVIGSERPHWHEDFQWKWKHEGIAKRIEVGELKVVFWNFGVCIPAIFGEDERRNLPARYRPPQKLGPEWYECLRDMNIR